MRRLLAFPILAASAGILIGAVPKTRPPVGWTLPTGLAVDAAGTLLVTDLATHRLLKLDRHGVLTLVAGSGAGGYHGDGGPAAQARLHAPHDVAVTPQGDLLIADTYNHRIRRIDRRGIITTVAGNGSGRRAGDGGGRSASLNNPQGIAVEPGGGLLIADTYNHVVRRVDAERVITVFAGTEAGLAGDGGPATRAQLSLPTGVAVAPDGSVYISDSGNNRIRRVKPDGTIETVAGTGPGSGTAGAGYGGDGGPAGKARLFAAADVEVGPAGQVLLSDTGNHRVRAIVGGVITTFAGSGIGAFGGDGGSRSAAGLNSPQKIALGPDGSLYIADRGNRRVRRVDPEGRIHTLAPR